MTTYHPNPTVTLSREGVAVTDAIVTSVSWRVGEGWSFQAFVIGDALDPYENMFTEYTISFTDGLGHSQTVPACYWIDRSYTHVDSAEGEIDQTIVNGEDAAIFNMRRANQSFDSYSNTTADVIVGDLATRAGVTISNAPNFDVYEEDVKGVKLSDALERYVQIAAYVYSVNTSGQIVCRAWEASGTALSFDWSVLTHQLDPRQIYTGVRYGKRSSAPYSGEQVYDFETTGFVTQELATPLTLPSAANESNGADGDIAAVTFYNADDEWVSHFDFTLGSRPEPGGVQGSGVCTYFIAEVEPGSLAGDTRARVRVTGTPEGAMPEGVDAEFLWPALTGPPDTSLGDWPYESDFIDQLWPSQAYAEARSDYVLSKLNSAGDRLLMRGPLQCGTGVQLFSEYTYRTRVYTTHEITWDFRQNQTSLTLVRKVTETLDV